jgi:hypothetical protein
MSIGCPHGLSTGITRPPPALDDLGDAASEEAVAAHDDLIPFVDQVADTCLHSRTPRSGEREGDGVLGHEDATQQLLDRFETAEIERIEIAEDRRRHGFEHAAVDVARPRAEEHAFGRMKRCAGGHGQALTAAGQDTPPNVLETRVTVEEIERGVVQRHEDRP